LQINLGEKDKMNKLIQTECAICRDYQDKENKRWHTPTPLQRRENHFHEIKLSHGYCPTCYILALREDGISEAEIELMVQEVESIK